MVIEHIDEPELDFGVGRHADIRFGILELGPHDIDQARRPSEILVGIVGSPHSVEGARAWLEKCKSEIPRKDSTKLNLFPAFPGFSASTCFKSEVCFDPSINQIVTAREIEKLDREIGYDEAISQACQIFEERIESIAEKSPDVILVSMPLELVTFLSEIEAKRKPNAKQIKVEFHDLLKARSLRFGVPLQFLRPSTYDSKMRRKELDKRSQVGSLQDEATRAWNFHTALYYKAGGFPYRVPRLEEDYPTCYVGVSFFVSPDKDSVNSSVANVFNERGHGLAVKGKEAYVSKTDMEPHLSEEDAEELLGDCLSAYRREHRTLPARVVIHKTSNFDEHELKGFEAKLDELGIELFDFIKMGRSGVRLYREGYYPPLRGTWLSADERNHFVYSRGSVSFYEEYPGMYVPRSLGIKLFNEGTAARDIVRETLLLTKTNWNNVQIDATLPITLTAAKKVSEILRWVPGGDPVQQAYRFYM